MRTFIDLAKMPNFNPKVKDNIDSVSTGKVEVHKYFVDRWQDARTKSLEDLGVFHSPASENMMAFQFEGECPPFFLYPHCVLHGAMSKVSADGIWRCVGLYRSIFKDVINENGNKVRVEVGVKENDCGVGCYEQS